MKIIKPKKLSKGSVIGIVTPSAPLPAIVPNRYERGLENLRKLGLRIIEGKYARSINGYLSGTPEQRASDINSFLHNSDVDGILCSIGGFHYNQLLNLIDYDQAYKTPKVFLGFSDATVLQLAFWTRCHLVTFSGPACLTQFADYPQIDAYTEEYFKKALFSTEPIGEIKPSKEWTDELLDWTTGEDVSRRRKYKLNKGWKWINEGKASGRLLGGCLSSMLHLAGTTYWPDFTDCLLLIDIPEGHKLGQGMPLFEVEMHIADLENLGVLDSIAGAIIGRPYGYSDKEHQALYKLIRDTFGKREYPVLMDIDYGHTDPLLTIPLGVFAKLDSENSLFEITEAGVCD